MSKSAEKAGRPSGRRPRPHIEIPGDILVPKTELAAEFGVVSDAVTAGRTRMIRLDDITVPADRMRQLRPEKVDEFAESIAARGQLQPIIIRPQDSGYVLVVGSHRLEAVRKLGHEAIECRVLDGMDADQALLAEIDENLVRADLTPSERAAHHAKRKQLYLKLHPETEKGKAGGRPRKTSDKMSKVSTKGYAKAAAKKVGKTSRTCRP